MKNSKPKQRFSLLTMALAAVLMVSGLSSCTSEPWDNPGLSSAISLSANVQATTHTKAAVSGTTFPASTGDVFRLTAFAGAAAPTIDWSAPYFNGIQVNSGAASALTFATAQYYPANGDKVYFYGYAPEATSLTDGTASTAPTANYTITGQEDIMAAQFVTGIAAATTGTQAQPTLEFTHKLMQVRFNIVKDASFEDGKKVTEIVVKDVKTSAKLDIATGELTFDGDADKTLSLPIVAGTNEITGGGTDMGGCVMMEPVGTGGSIALRVTTDDGVEYDNIKVTITGNDNGKAGTSHLITLTFKRGGITPSASITEWADGGGSSADVGGPPPAVGDYYYSDGTYSTELKTGKTATGLVYYLDPADPWKYKVMALEESSSTLKWAASNSYFVSGAQSDTDGKANSVAIQTAFDAKSAGITISETDFTVAFPAAAYCYNYKGEAGTDVEGSWHLPARNELQWVCCAYNGKAPTGWATGTGAGISDATAQTSWNNRITAGGGAAGITDGIFWSSTDYMNTTYAWNIHFSSSNTYYTKKEGDNLGIGCTVRCVRDI